MGVDAKAKAAVKKPAAHPNTWVFFDGDFARYNDVKLGLMTHALHYGTAVFEGIRAYWNQQKNQLYLLQAAAHYDRMKRSANVMRMTLPYSTEELVNFTIDLLRRNEFKSDVYVRPLLYTSSEEIGVRLHNLNRAFFIYAIPFGNYVEIEAGIRCMVSSWRRVPDQSLPARAKITGSYAQAALAKSEAVEGGFDEAIVLSIDGHVSEGSAENLFMLKDGAFVTPPVTDDILEGVTRQLLIKVIGDELNLPVLERSIDRTELYTCDELLLCGTGAQISPVIEVDRRPVGNGKVGEFTQAEVVEVPVADGGDGTVEALVSANHGDYRAAQVEGPLGDPVSAQYGLIESGRKAVVELATASGLTLIPLSRRDPRRTSTYGFGQLLEAARRDGAETIIAGIGGSATNDGGAGMAQALGYRLLDADGRDLPRGGAALSRLRRIESAGFDRGWRSVAVKVACDVTNPLTGPSGASAIYGPQEGADAAAVRELAAAVGRRAEVSERDLGRRVAGTPGAA